MIDTAKPTVSVPLIADLRTGNWVTIAKAAELIGCSEKHIRRRRHLIGRRLAHGRWMIFLPALFASDEVQVVMDVQICPSQSNPVEFSGSL